jgi:MFS family permease
MGNLFWSDSQDNTLGVFDGDGVPGRLLRCYVLGPALSHDGAKALNRLFHRLPVSADYRLVRWLVGAWLADRIGRRNLFLTFSLGAIVIVLVYTQLTLPNEALWILGFPLGFFASGYFSGVGAFLTELYPTRLRGSGQGFCYNFGRGVGALFPFLVGALSNSTSLANAIAVFAVAAYAVFFLAAFALPETRGRVLHAEA